MGKNNSKRKEVTDFQRHESRMAKLEHRLKKEEEARLRMRKARQEAKKESENETA